MAETVIVLDFDKRIVRRVSYDGWRHEMDEGCRKAGHIFASVWPHWPADGAKCMCGDETWPRRS